MDGFVCTFVCFSVVYFKVFLIILLHLASVAGAANEISRLRLRRRPRNQLQLQLWPHVALNQSLLKGAEFNKVLGCTR